MRYLKRKDKPEQGIILATSEEDMVCLQKLKEDRVLRGIYLFWTGGAVTDPQVAELLKAFPRTKSFILLNNS